MKEFDINALIVDANNLKGSLDAILAFGLNQMNLEYNGVEDLNMLFSLIGATGALAAKHVEDICAIEAQLTKGTNYE